MTSGDLPAGRDPTTLPAGRELDALIAEKVMGVAILSHDVMLAEANRVWKQQPQCTQFFWGFTAYRRQGLTEVIQKFKPYSTSIAAAWEVLEKITERGARNRYPTIWQDKGSDLWVCEFGDVQGGWRETAPHAICLAALKAVRA